MEDLSSLEMGSARTRPSTPVFAGLHIDRSIFCEDLKGLSRMRCEGNWLTPLRSSKPEKVEPRFPLTPAMERCADQACLLRLLLNAFAVT